MTLAMIKHAYEWHALGAAVAIGVVCSLLSVVVVLKRMAFIGQGVSHAGFGGVGTAALLGFTVAGSPVAHDVIVFVFCFAAAMIIGALSRRRRVESDTAIGILLAATMAWGVIAQNLRVEWAETWPAYREWVGGFGYTPPWEAILFGSLFNVGAGGMLTAAAMAVIVMAIGAAVYKEMLFFVFDESVSRVYGVRNRMMHYLLLTLLAAVVFVSIRLVGLILVTALLIMPGAAALQLSARMGVVLVVAVLIGVSAAVGGLMLCFAVATLSPGACIVGALTVLFGVACVVGRSRGAGAGAGAGRATSAG